MEGNMEEIIEIHLSDSFSDADETQERSRTARPLQRSLSHQQPESNESNPLTEFTQRNESTRPVYSDESFLIFASSDGSEQSEQSRQQTEQHLSQQQQSQQLYEEQEFQQQLLLLQQSQQQQQLQLQQLQQLQQLLRQSQRQMQLLQQSYQQLVQQSQQQLLQELQLPLPEQTQVQLPHIQQLQQVVQRRLQELLQSEELPQPQQLPHTQLLQQVVQRRLRELLQSEELPQPRQLPQPQRLSTSRLEDASLRLNMSLRFRMEFTVKFSFMSGDLEEAEPPTDLRFEHVKQPIELVQRLCEQNEHYVSLPVKLEKPAQLIERENLRSFDQPVLVIPLESEEPPLSESMPQHQRSQVIQPVELLQPFQLHELLPLVQQENPLPLNRALGMLQSIHIDQLGQIMWLNRPIQLVHPVQLVREEPQVQQVQRIKITRMRQLVRRVQPVLQHQAVQQVQNIQTIIEIRKDLPTTLLYPDEIEEEYGLSVSDLLEESIETSTSEESDHSTSNRGNNEDTENNSVFIVSSNYPPEESPPSSSVINSSSNPNYMLGPYIVYRFICVMLYYIVRFGTFLVNEGVLFANYIGYDNLLEFFIRIHNYIMLRLQEQAVMGTNIDLRSYLNNAEDTYSKHNTVRLYFLCGSYISFTVAPTRYLFTESISSERVERYTHYVSITIVTNRCAFTYIYLIPPDDDQTNSDNNIRNNIYTNT